jgi:hypothetical protein
MIGHCGASGVNAHHIDHLPRSRNGLAATGPALLDGA